MVADWAFPALCADCACQITLNSSVVYYILSNGPDSIDTYFNASTALHWQQSKSQHTKMVSH